MEKKIQFPHGYNRDKTNEHRDSIKTSCIAKNTAYDSIREKDKIIYQYEASGQHGSVYITE